MQGSPLKVNIKFGWRAGCRAEEPCEQAGAFEEKLIFCCCYLFFINGFLCGLDGSFDPRADPLGMRAFFWLSHLQILTQVLGLSAGLARTSGKSKAMA